MANQIVSSLDFIKTCGLELDPLLRSVDFFTSHEGLHLESVTRHTHTHTHTHTHIERTRTSGL